MSAMLNTSGRLYSSFWCNYDLKVFRKQVENSRLEAEKDGIKVPTTLEEYCQTQKQPTTSASSDICDDFYDDDLYQDDDDDDDDDIEVDSSESDV